MILCGWCNSTTRPGLCSHCGRNPALPWLQRDEDPPLASEENEVGRPRLDPGQIRHKIRLARKELGDDATNAELAEYLQISERQLSRWREVAGDKRPQMSTFRAVSVTPPDDKIVL